MSSHTPRLVVLAVAAAAVALTTSTAPAAAIPERALSWLSTGDSYSAGEGVRGNEGACAQSSEAWGPLAADTLAADHGWDIDARVFSACTGHLVQDFYNARPEVDNPASLWDWALGQPGAPDSGRFDVITMSFGGNDIGFADVILDCLAAPIHKYDSWDEILDRGVWFAPVLAKDVVSTSTADVIPFFGDDCDAQEGTLERRVDMLFEPSPCGLDAWRGGRTEFTNYDCELIIDAERGITGSMVDFWLHVVATSLEDDGVLVVQGYPALFAESDQWGLGQGLRCNGVTRGDANMLGRVADYFDSKLKSGVDTANRLLGENRIIYASVSDLYADGGHSLCGPGDDWLNGSITLTRDQSFFVAMPVTGYLAVNPGYRFRHLGAFHPQQGGHAAEAQQVADLLADRGPPTGRSTSPSIDRGPFVGDWSGLIQGPGRSFDALISLAEESGALRGSIEHPDLPCLGELVELVAADGVTVFNPSYTPESDCIHNGTIRLTVLGADQLRYEWFHPTSTRVDTGTLNRVVAVQPTSPSSEATFEVAPASESRFSDSYFARVLSAEHVGGFSVAITFEAQGARDLRRPETSCMVHDDGFIALPIETRLDVDVAGRYRGVQVYPLIVAGGWSLRYSCQSDYSDAYVGAIRFGSVGMSTYSNNYYATIFGTTIDAAGNLVVRFASHGYTSSLNELRDPATSCLVAGGTDVLPSSVDYGDEVPGLYYEGTITFPATNASSSFLYSCETDYSTQQL